MFDLIYLLLFFLNLILNYPLQIFKLSVLPFRLWEGGRLVHVDLCVPGKHVARNWRDSGHAAGHFLYGWLLQRGEHSFLFGFVTYKHFVFPKCLQMHWLTTHWPVVLLYWSVCFNRISVSSPLINCVVYFSLFQPVSIQWESWVQWWDSWWDPS